MASSPKLALQSSTLKASKLMWTHSCTHGRHPWQFHLDYCDKLEVCLCTCGGRICGHCHQKKFFLILSCIYVLVYKSIWCAYVRETYVDINIIKPESHFLDDKVDKSRVASKIHKVKLAMNTINKGKVDKPKSQVPNTKQVAK